MNKHIKKLAQEAFNDFEKKPVIINKPKELLELAAKAIGKQYPFIQKDQDGRVWGPHLDDGDAFRLAIELGLTIIQDTKDKVCAVHWTDVAGVHVAWKDDKYAATRQAIVRAAAEIGKSLS